MIRRFLALALLIAAGSCVTAVDVCASRSPTPHELRNIKARISISGESYIRISTVNSSYVAIYWGHQGGRQAAEIDQILSGSRARFVYGFNPGQPRDGACAFAPATVVRDLLAVRCPTWRALHARAARATERDTIRAAFSRSPRTHRWAEHSRLIDICVSRLAPEWAAGDAAFPSTAGTVWFRHQRRRWIPVYDTIDSQGALPPRAIVLSLASCTGYNAAEYGA